MTQSPPPLSSVPPSPPPSSPASRDAYYRDAESWNHDREAGLRSARRIAWIAASVAALIALAEACALVALAPLKTVQPYTLLVDRQTGYVQALDPLQPARIGADTALTQSFVVQYVIARESFDIAAAQANYKKVAAWSAGPVRSRYIAEVQSSNPNSPIATLPRSTVIETRVKSVSISGPNTLLVRFDTQRRDDGQTRAPQPWVALVRYRYDGEPATLEARLLNPLGFRVTHYQRSAEAPVPNATPVTTVQTGDAAGAGSPAPEMSAVPAAVPATLAARTDDPVAVTGPVPPSPLRAVPQPRYVTRFPTPAGAPAGAPIIGYNRRGQPIIGANP